MELPEGEVFCTTYADCATLFPDAMSKWDAFYQVPALHSLVRLLPGWHSAVRSLPSLKTTVIFSTCVCLKGLKAVVESHLPEGEKKDSLLGLYWAAHMATSSASSACSTRSPVGLL